jgi:hypothetical protein
MQHTPARCRCAKRLHKSFRRAVGFRAAVVCFHPVKSSLDIPASCASGQIVLSFCSATCSIPYGAHSKLPRLAGWKSPGCSRIANISVIQSQFASRIRESECWCPVSSCSEVQDVVASGQMYRAPPHQAMSAKRRHQLAEIRT